MAKIEYCANTEKPVIIKQVKVLVLLQQYQKSIGIASAIPKTYWYWYCNPFLKFILVLVLKYFLEVGLLLTTLTDNNCQRAVCTEGFISLV